MNCNRIKDLLPDAWEGALDADTKARLELHLAECPSCREENESLGKLWNKLGALPSEAPGPEMRPRFHAMLEGYQQGVGLVSAPRRRGFADWSGAWFPRRPLLQFGFSALLLLSGFMGGYFLNATHMNRGELASLREEVHDMRRMVTMSLLKQQSASERLKGVSWSGMVNRPDPEFIAALLHTLNYDPTVDVRLAAADALSRFLADASVTNGLIDSLHRQDSPLVQISLIDLLVQFHERQSVEALKQIINDASQNQLVRQRAQWGLQKLS